MEMSFALPHRPKSARDGPIFSGANNTRFGRRKFPLTAKAAPLEPQSDQRVDEDDEANPYPKPEPYLEVWSPFTTSLMDRTARAYDLVLNYERDSHGGQRWSHDDIIAIRQLGSHLHADIFALKQAARALLLLPNVGERGFDSERREARLQAVVQQAEGVRAYCEKVQQGIRDRESRFLPVDEEGNIFTEDGSVYDAQGNRYSGSIEPENYARKGLFFV